MTYESVSVVESKIAPGVTFTVVRISFARRVDLMRRIRDLAGRMEFLKAGQDPDEQMETALLQAEIDRTYVGWGLKAVDGLLVDGLPATPELLAESGPEKLFREALSAVRAETEFSEAERKN